MRRSRFLPVFFTVLSIAFVITLVLRLRSDMREQTVRGASTPRPPAPSESVAPAPTTTAATETTATLVEVGQPSIAPMPVASQASGAPTADGLSSQSKPSLFSRMIAPVVKALGGGASTTSSKPGSSQPQSRGNTSSSTSTSTDTAQKHDPKDPNSDSLPPQLISVQFVPAQVQDGEESTIIITAVDDLSGIRGISGTMASPTGKALQGFATQREGDTNRYVGRVVIAKNAEEGLWKASFINMSDNASNSVTLSFAAGTIPPSAVLRVVSSNSDNTPPTLKNIWVDRPTMRGGDKDTLFIEATDDKSGVNLVSAVFQSPSKSARIGAGCQHGDGDVWQCEFSVPTCVDCGDWQLEQVTLQDKANNLVTMRQDNPLVRPIRINIAGASCDKNPPVLQSLALDTNDLVLGDRGATVTITIMVSDDSCGVAGASGQYVGPGAGSGGFFPMQQSGDSGMFIGRIQLDPHAARGTWRINSIQLNDHGHNLRVYYSSDPLLANGVFRVR